MNESLYDFAKELTDAVIPPVKLKIGHHYNHPEDGVIKITEGYYRDPKYDRISNFWCWEVIATGEKHSGYGSHWPEVRVETNE